MSTKIFQKATKLHLLLIILLNLHFFAAKSLNLTLKLVHRDSPESPVYPGKLSTREKIQKYVKSSEARAAYLNARRSSSPAKYKTTHPTVVNPEVRPYESTYMVSIGVGEPLKSYWLILDTASDLSWIQCQPCTKCFAQDDPIFNPEQSKTYERVLCSDTTPCDKGRECKQASCIYHTFYKDGSTSKGTLSRENFTLFSASDGRFVFRTTFGCSDYAEGSYKNKVAGVLGMNLDPESFMSQLAKDTIDRFTYCLVDQDAYPNGHSYLKFDSIMYGERSDFKMTPLIRHPNDFGYYVGLEDISINGIRMNFPKDTFAIKPDGTGGCLMDTGTTMTMIEQFAFLQLAAAYEAHFEQRGIKRMVCPPDYGIADLVCFPLPSKDYNDFPSVTFHFSGGADLYIEPKHAFTVQRDDSAEEKYFYPNFKPMTHLTIIGTLQTPNVRFVFDNDIHQLAFAPERCEQDRGLF